MVRITSCRANDNFLSLGLENTVSSVTKCKDQQKKNRNYKKKKKEKDEDSLVSHHVSEEWECIWKSCKQPIKKLNIIRRRFTYWCFKKNIDFTVIKRILRVYNFYFTSEIFISG